MPRQDQQVSRRAAIALTLVSLLLLTGSGVAWTAARLSRDQVARTAEQQDVYARAQSALLVGGCAQARTSLQQTIRLAADPATTRRATSDQKACDTYQAIHAREDKGPAGTVVSGYLKLLGSSPPPGLAHVIRPPACAAGTRRWSRTRSCSGSRAR